MQMGRDTCTSWPRENGAPKAATCFDVITDTIYSVSFRIDIFHGKDKKILDLRPPHQKLDEVIVQYHQKTVPGSGHTA